MTPRRSKTWLWLVLGALVLVSRGSGSSSSSPPRPKAPGAPPMTDAEMLALATAIRSTGLSADAMLLVLTLESGLDPHATSGSAFGLNQAQGPLLRAAGWTEEPRAFGKLSISEQAPWLAKMLTIQIQQVGRARIRNALDLYVMNLSPSAARSGKEVIYSRDNPAERDFYEGNKRVFDPQGTGVITREQVKRVLDRVNAGSRYQAAAAQLARVMGAKAA